MRVAVLISFGVLGLIACGGYGYEARTTTITGAPMITSGPAAGESELSRTLGSTSQRVALEVCTHENRCGRGDVSECVDATLGRAREELTRWNCDPATTRARFEECLAGIDEVPCDVNLRTDRPNICPTTLTCGEVNAARLVSPGPELAKIFR